MSDWRTDGGRKRNRKIPRTAAKDIDCGLQHVSHGGPLVWQLRRLRVVSLLVHEESEEGETFLEDEPR